MTVERNMLMASAGKSSGVPVSTGPYAPPSSYYHGKGVAASPVNNNFMMVGDNDGETYNGIIVYSSDGGLTFPDLATPTYSLYYIYFDCVACGPSGAWLVGGVDYNISNGVIIRSTDNGATWSGLKSVGNGGNTTHVNAIGTDGAGNWIAAAYQEGAGANQFTSWFSKSVDDGVTWTAIARFNGYTGQYIPNSVTYSNGRWIVYGGNYSGSGVVKVTTSTDGGTTWTTPTDVSTSAGGSNAACTTTGTWVGSGLLNSTGVAFTRTTDGTTWSAPALVTPGYTTAFGGPTVTYLPNSGKFAMFSVPTTTTGPQYWLSSDSGATWGTRKNVYATWPGTPTWYWQNSASNSTGRVVFLDGYFNWGTIANL